MTVEAAVAVICLALLVGCNRKAEPMIPPDMAVAPGAMRFDSGQRIHVIGYDHCPDTGYMLIGRIASRNMEKHCTIVSKETSSFDIHIGTTAGVIRERWTVAADEDSIRLVRPDGDWVTIVRRAR
ncbi:hypothetical protein ACI77O_12830 [Pseudomonas tritici]|uniref:hypothetical protein n=1 Tax=Pseudomonas tritici TaxID=2745518 RepID=UPI00387B165A